MKIRNTYIYTNATFSSTIFQLINKILLTISFVIYAAAAERNSVKNGKTEEKKIHGVRTRVFCKRQTRLYLSIKKFFRYFNRLYAASIVLRLWKQQFYCINQRLKRQKMPESLSSLSYDRSLVVSSRKLCEFAQRQNIVVILKDSERSLYVDLN